MVGLGPELAVPGFEALGIPRPQATAFVEALDDRMGASVLALYRSAVPELLASWVADVGAMAARPGLAVRATDDGYTGDRHLVEEAAASAGADLVTLEGLGHWWMLQDPVRAASTLTSWFDRNEA